MIRIRFVYCEHLCVPARCSIPRFKYLQLERDASARVLKIIESRKFVFSLLVTKYLWDSVENLRATENKEKALYLKTFQTRLLL